MNYFNHKNVQLAYEAVYNQDLCESMEDLGLIGEYDYLDEAKTGEWPVSVGGMPLSGRIRKLMKMAQNPNNPLPMDHPAYNRRKPTKRTIPPIKKGKQEEAYELYNEILEYLIYEGYADTLGSAEIILENMSDEWIEDILLEKEGYGDDSKFQGDTDADDFIPGKTVPKPKSYGRLSRFAPSPLSGERSRTSSNVRRTVGESPNQPRAVQMPGERKARRVIPSRLDRKKG